MIERLGDYDKNLGMYRRDVDPYVITLRRLKFLRWLVEKGELEHPIEGKPEGYYAEGLTVGERAHYEATWAYVKIYTYTTWRQKKNG